LGRGFWGSGRRAAGGASDEKTKLASKCVGKKIELAIAEATIAFGGRLRLKGGILAVN